jgi:hypothetical protein
MALFYARAFGLTFASDVPVPGLTPVSEARADVHVHMRGFPPWFEAQSGDAREIWSSDHDPNSPADTASVSAVTGNRLMHVAYGDGVEFLVSRSGDRIWVRGPKGFLPETAATYLLGPIIGLALRLRGVTCLHASVVAVGAGAVAFAGDAGAGKSTVAAAFAQRGHRVLADDIAALSPAGAGWVVEPGAPSVRLWDDSVALLMGAPDALPLMAAGWEKRYLDLSAHGGGFSAGQPLPLEAIYVLERSGPSAAEAAWRRLSPRDALIVLVGNTYANVLLDREMRAAEFDVLSRLVTTVPVWRIHAPGSRAALDEFCAHVARGVPA